MKKKRLHFIISIAITSYTEIWGLQWIAFVISMILRVYDR